MHKGLFLMATSVLGWGMAGAAWAQEAGRELPGSGADINDIQSLQRGAHHFMDYCAGCHSLKYMRYNRIATDLRRRGFSFVGSTIVYAYLQATGVVDDHYADCFRAGVRA